MIKRLIFTLNLSLLFLSLFGQIESGITNTVGELVDSRDGKTYKTVTLGNQVWMAENLAFELANGCLVYQNDTSNVEKFGYLYDWDAAIIACPEGWHLPSTDEYDILFQNLGENSIERYESLIVGGFSNLNVYLAGVNLLSGFQGKGFVSFLWTSSAEKYNNAMYVIVTGYRNKAFMNKCTNIYNFSVRCLEDK